METQANKCCKSQGQNHAFSLHWESSTGYLILKVVIFYSRTQCFTVVQPNLVTIYSRTSHWKQDYTSVPWSWTEARWHFLLSPSHCIFLPDQLTKLNEPDLLPISGLVTMEVSSWSAANIKFNCPLKFFWTQQQIKHEQKSYTRSVWFRSKEKMIYFWCQKRLKFVQV